VLVKGRGLARWAPVIPSAGLTLVGGLAAIVLGAQNPGYGEAGIAVLVTWVVGSPLGLVMQMIFAAIVWALSLGIADAARNPGRSTWITVGGVVLLHVALKALFAPLIFGVIGALLGLALGVRRQNGLAIAFFAVVALAGISLEIGWMYENAREQAEEERYLRESQATPDPS
jgi:hypothetical protein